MKKSDKIVIEAPMSFTGSAKRIWRYCGNPVVGLLIGLPLIIVAWCFVLAWYAIFGIWVIPYRLVRRGQRKQKLEAARYAEIMGRKK